MVTTGFEINIKTLAMWVCDTKSYVKNVCFYVHGLNILFYYYSINKHINN